MQYISVNICYINLKKKIVFSSVSLVQSWSDSIFHHFDTTFYKFGTN